MGELITFPEKRAKIEGNWETKEVKLNGRRLSPKKSQKVRNHSPDGFNWSYGGSGPAQLALAVMLEFFPKEQAQRLYQDFKRTVIAGLPAADFNITVDIDDWLETTAKMGY